MSEKKKLKDKETEKVDGGVFPGTSGFPSPAKVKTKLSDSAENETIINKKTIEEEQ